MKKRTVSLVLLSPVFLLVAIYTLLISPLGGPTIKVIANTFVSDLHIEEIEGGLADSLTISQLTWRNAQWDVRVEEVYADITWRCLFEPRVCVNDFAISHADIKQLAASPTQEDTAPQSEVTLPLPIDISTLTLNQVNLSLLTVHVSLSELNLEGFEGESAISLNHLALKELQVLLVQEQDSSSSTNTASSPSLPTSYSLNYSVPSLPEISAPLPISIGTFLLEGMTFEQGSNKQQLRLLSLTEASFKNSDLKVDDIVVVHPFAEVKGTLSTTLSDNYPLAPSIA